MKRLVAVTLCVLGAIVTCAVVLARPVGIHEPTPMPIFEVSDKPLFTLEQQRELVNDHRTAVYICGELNVFEWSGDFPEELKPYMWGYPE